MFFALTDDQQRVRRRRARLPAPTGSTWPPSAGSSRTPTATATRPRCGRPRGEQGWLAVLVPEEHDGLGLGLLEAQVIARALGAGVGAGAVARHRARRRGDPAGRARPSSRRRWLPRLGRRATARRARLATRGRDAPGRSAGSSSTAASPTCSSSPRRTACTWSSAARPSTPRAARYDGTVAAGRPSTGGAGEELAGAAAGGRAELPTGPPCSSPPTWSASPARRSPARSPTTGAQAVRRAGRVVPGDQARRWPTCTSRSPWPSTPRSTPRTPSTSGADDAALAVAVAKAKAGDAAVASDRRDDPVPRRHRLHLGARGAPVLQARQAAGRAVGSATPTAPASRS